jgi:serine/threonine protein kinase
MATTSGDWILDYKQMSLGDMVGVGATAAVFKCTYAGTTVAAKRIPCFEWNGANKEQLRREATVLAKLHHPNIVHFYGVVMHAQHVFVVTEYVPRSLTKHLDLVKAGGGLELRHRRPSPPARRPSTTSGAAATRASPRPSTTASSR